MRVSCKGFYVQYKDSSRPVEVLDRVNYSFQSEDRTCYVERTDHLAMLLKTDRYRIVGAEIDAPNVLGAVKPADLIKTPEITGAVSGPLPPKPRGRPRKEK